MWHKIKSALNQFESVFAVVLFSSILVITFLQIVGRSFGIKIFWTEELSRYLFLWVVFIGFSIGIKDDVHFKVTILEDKLKGKARVALLIIINIIFLLFVVYVLKESINNVYTRYLRQQVSPTMGMPIFIVNLALPIGLSLSVINLLDRLLFLYKTIVKKR